MAEDEAEIYAAQEELLRVRSQKNEKAARKSTFFSKGNLVGTSDSPKNAQKSSSENSEPASPETKITTQLVEKMSALLESKNITTQPMFSFQPGRKNQVQDKQDLLQVDASGRTVLHRAAIEQNYQLVEELCSYAEEKGLYGEYINQKDRFGNTPVLLSCVLDAAGMQPRFKTIEPLLRKGADIHVRNPRTLWTPLTWCCYYGDIVTVRKLLELGARPYLPDSSGRYPLDLAGRKGHKVIVHLLIDNLMKEIQTYDANLENDNYRAREDLKYVRTPLLRCNVLYWSCYYSVGISKIRSQLACLDTYPEFPIAIESDRSAIHACCRNGNVDALKELLVGAKSLHRKIHLNFRDGVNNPLLFSTNVLPLTKVEKKKTYKKRFVRNIKDLNKWMVGYYAKCQATTPEEESKLRLFDGKDRYGNTPLHITAFKGQAECAKLLLDEGADPEEENNDGWRCIELRRHTAINELFTSHLKKKQEEALARLHAKDVGGLSLNAAVQKNAIAPEPKKKNNLNASHLEDSNALIVKRLQKMNIDRYELEQTRMTPDIVISFKINAPDKQRREFLMGRMNFYIQILTQTKFDVYLAKGVVKGDYILLLKMNETYLEQECHQLGMKVKLLESFQQEPFDISRRTEFEPFRSLERQEICLSVLQKLINLDALKSQKIIHEYYRMHSIAGLNRIKRIWISQPKWYWPQPLCALKEYTTPSRNHNYTAITALKHYFGEKIAFFFAFTSFLSSYLFYLGLPGLGVFIFFMVRRYHYGSTDDDMYDHPLLPAWVGYVMLWNVCTVEGWKRKNAEIATRWGIHIHGREDTGEHAMSRIRKDFSGDECISHNIGLLTKKFRFPATLVTFMISLPILIVLLACVVGTFLGTERFKEWGKEYENGKYNTAIQFVAGIVNGLSIFILNTTYTLLARWFVKKENHKYQESHERSLIVKTFIFRFLNSLIGVFYVAYFQKDNDDNYSTLQEVFILLLTLVLTKQGTSIFTLTVLPWVIYKLNQKRYFYLAQRKAATQRLLRGEHDVAIQPSGSLETPEKAWKKCLRFICCCRPRKKPEILLSRSVMDCKRGLAQDYWELSHVELNGIRNSFKDLVDSYGETFVLLSFITLFAAAFPIGPLLALLCVIIDIRFRLLALMNVYDRPPADHHSGIGYWLQIWEIITVASVFTNLILLYRHLNYDWTTISIFDQTGEFAKLFIFIIIEHGILLLKYFFADIIPDVPKWVVKAQMKQDSQEELEIKHLKEKHKEALEKIQETNAFLNRGKLTERIQDLQQRLELKDQQIERLIAERKETNAAAASSLDAGIKLVLYDVFATIERELLIQRVADINELNGDNLAIRCTICSLKKAVLEYKSTQEYVCRKCFFTVQSKLNFADKQVSLLPFRAPEESDVGLQEELEKLQKNNANFIDNLAVTKHGDSAWKKFEYYSFPVNIQSEQYEQLSQAFKLLQQIYITTNGISALNQVVDEQKFFRIRKTDPSSQSRNQTPNKKAAVHASADKKKATITDPKEIKLIEEEEKNPDKRRSPEHSNPSILKKAPEGKGQSADSPASVGSSTLTAVQKSVFKTELRLENYESYLKFVQLSNFNIEEKLFMNKTAFLIFKRHGAQTKFQEFFRIIKSLQDGTLENKVYMLFDLLDENDDGLINRDDLFRVIRSSYLQSTTGKEESRQVVMQAFKDQTLLDKKTAFPKILNEPGLKGLLSSLLQEVCEVLFRRMATGDVKVKFIFSNYQGKSNVLDVAPTLKIAEIKQNVLTSFIVQNYAPADKVGKIRLFNLGAEMKEEQTLNDCKKTGTEGEGYDFVIHVHVNPEQQKSGKQKTNSQDKKDGGCKIF